MLQLSKVELNGAELGTINWAGELEKNSLRFAFEDGRITAVCPVDGEQKWALNVKRGILSTFLNSMDDGFESDVGGECPVEIEQSGQTIKKMKNLTACTDAHHVHGLRNVPYKVHSVSLLY